MRLLQAGLVTEMSDLCNSAEEGDDEEASESFPSELSVALRSTSLFTGEGAASLAGPQLIRDDLMRFGREHREPRGSGLGDFRHMMNTFFDSLHRTCWAGRPVCHSLRRFG